MYAVIFKAKFAISDNEYIKTANRMRELAMDKYGCKDFVSVCENNEEITISYWESEEQIKEWKKNAEHIIAQELGQSKWYESYNIEIVKIVREYSSFKHKKLTIQEAIKKTLKDISLPMSANEILEHINKNKYYLFGAKKPINAVRPELKKLFDKKEITRKENGSQEFVYLLHMLKGNKT